MMSQRPCFILEGNGPCTNRGCEAILRSTMAILQREFSRCDFINSGWMRQSVRDAELVEAPNLTHRPPMPMRRLSWAWFTWQFEKVFLGRKGFPFERHLAKADAVLALGGDNFSLDYARGSADRQFDAAELVVRGHKPMIVWGASVGPFDRDPAYEKLAIEKLRGVTMICVRESLTREYLESHGLGGLVRQMADPAFVLAPAEPPVLPQDLRAALETGSVGINLSPLLGRYLQDPSVWPAAAGGCVAAIDAAVQMPLVLIPHVMCQGNDDHIFLDDLRKRLGKPRNPIHLLPRQLNAMQIKWVISQLTAFIGARTHATIAALSTCVPTISVGYSVKARGINQDIFGHTDWVVPLADLAPGPLAERAGQLLAGAESVRRQLGRTMPDYKQRAWGGGQFVREAMQRR